MVADKAVDRAQFDAYTKAIEAWAEVANNPDHEPMMYEHAMNAVADMQEAGVPKYIQGIAIRVAFDYAKEISNAGENQ